MSFVPCASCGHPTNGAPPRPVVSGASNTLPMVIGLVVGLFVLIAIVGILAAIAIPNLLTAQQRSRQKRTMADMRTIAAAVEAYATDTNQYPPANAVEELRPFLVPKYLKDLPYVDGWGNGLWYAKLQETGYVIVSAGADKEFEQDAGDRYTSATTQRFDCDIVFSNGAFLQYPEGVQSGGSE